VLKGQRARPDDVTILIGVRDRSDYRIVNALRSIRGQIEPPGAVKVMVVDYGSEPAGARFVQKLCGRYDADYVRVDASGIWSRGRCLNVGLRRVDTTFTMVTDADIVLSPRYVADAVATLREAPFSVVCASMLDLPEGSVDAWRAVALDEAPLDVPSWREQCAPRLDRELHSSIAITYSAYFQLIRGYDEHYEGWGREDADLMRRFRALGLQRRALASSSFYLHQWHPKFEGLTDDEQTRSIERNAGHYRTHRSIVRNGRDWGLGGRLTFGGQEPSRSL
jgi:hypothetical protein